MIATREDPQLPLARLRARGQLTELRARTCVLPLPNRIKGHLGRQWTEWFGGLAITLEDSGDTLLTGMVADQAALYGLLRKVRDLGMPLL